MASPQPDGPAAQDAAAIDYQGEAATALFETCIRDATMNMASRDRARADLRACMFYRGGSDNFWTVWNPTTNRYEQRPYDDSDEGLPAWIPRAATNVFGSKIDGITAVLDQSKPILTWRGSTDDDSDAAAAEVAEKSYPVLLDEIRYDQLSHRANQLVALTDKVAFVYHYDTDARHGTAPLEQLACANEACEAAGAPLEAEQADAAGGMCPDCGQPLELAPDPDHPGAILTTDTPKGKLCAYLWTSFEFSLPSTATIPDEEANPWVLGHARMAKEDVLRQWGDVEGIKDLLDAGARDNFAAGSRNFAEQLRRMSAPLLDRQVGKTWGASEFEGPLVYRLFHDPTDAFPEGFQGARIGDVIVEAGPLSVKDSQGTPKKPVCIRTYRYAPGSAHGKPPADDLVPLQEQRCLVETLILLIWMHDAAPTTYLPLSITLEDEPTGRPGEFVRFKSMIPGESPIRSQGLNPPESLFRGLEMIDEQFEKLSNLNAVLAGQRPEGDPTLGEVQILEERGMAAFKTPLDLKTSFELRQARILLAIARDSMWSPRFYTVAGDNAGWQVQQFTGADLGGTIDVTADPASAWPRSPLAVQMRLKLAMELGVLIPAQDPELAEKLLQVLGLAEFKPSLDVDRKQIARVLDLWREATLPEHIPPPSPVDNLPLHLAFKSNFLKTEEYELLLANNPPLAMAMLDHVRMLQQVVAQQQMAAQGPAPGPGGKPPESGGPGAPEPPQGDQNPASPMAGLVSSGVLQPAGEQAQASAQASAPSINQLVQARVLTPVDGGGPPA